MGKLAILLVMVARAPEEITAFRGLPKRCLKKEYELAVPLF